MRFPGFIGPSYTLQSVNVDCQRTVNLYPEMDESGDGDESEIMSLVGTPGLKLLLTLGASPVRGLYTASNGSLFAVGGDKLYQISSSWTATELGTLKTSLGPVSFSDNGLDVVVVDGPFGYSWTISSSTFAQITDSNFLGADQVTFQDGYLIFNKPSSDEFYLSGINALTFDALDIATVEASPDNLVGLVSIQENLYLFGTNTIEVFYDSGATFPFERIQGAVIEIGCAAAFSIAKIQNSAYWLGQDISGRGIVYRMMGFQPERISTFAIEHVIAGLSDLSGARAWTYNQGGHAFYCLNLPGATTTWVFDATTSLWHERATLSLGQYQRHRADCHAFAFNTNVVGDYSNGKIYSLDSSQYSDDSIPIVRERTSPHVAKDKKRIFYPSFQLDMETGVGIDGSGQGSSPQVMLQWSDDAGHSWSNEHWASAGSIGARLSRVIWRRLGSARDRVFRVRISDPIKVTMIGAELEAELGDA